MTGAAVGFPLGAAVSLLVPGVGPVLAVGLIGAPLLGAVVPRRARRSRRDS